MIVSSFSGPFLDSRARALAHGSSCSTPPHRVAIALCQFRHGYPVASCLCEDALLWELPPSFEPSLHWHIKLNRAEPQTRACHWGCSIIARRGRKVAKGMPRCSRAPKGGWNWLDLYSLRENMLGNGECREIPTCRAHHSARRGISYMTVPRVSICDASPHGVDSLIALVETSVVVLGTPICAFRVANGDTPSLPCS